MKNKIHFIGICGVAMSALALAFKKIGWKVTGSDVGFYPPVSTYLKDAGIAFYPGWHLEKMIKGGAPDLVVVGNVAGSNNPEWQYVQTHKLNYKSYPEVVAEYIIKENSIVCAGTYGKTTTAAIMTWILRQNSYSPSYLFGGILNNSDGHQPLLPLKNKDLHIPSSEITKSAWSVLEGDEYKSSRWDNGAKFFHYSPTHLLLTSVVWDHADVYQSEKDYFAAFKKLVAITPVGSMKIISEKALPIIELRGKELDGLISYGHTAGNDYVYTNVKETTSGVEFDILYKDRAYHLATHCLGEYMADNLTGCFALAHQIGLEPIKIIEAITEFPGIKRRLEKRLETSVTVFDDIAHSPTKAQATLESLRKMYVGKIYAVFEPNTGNRERSAAAGYSHAFAAADEVIIPRLTKIKVSGKGPLPLDGPELAEIITNTHPRVNYFGEDEELITYLQQKIQPKDVVVFLGSHGFRGMIEDLVEKFDANQQI